MKLKTFDFCISDFTYLLDLLDKKDQLFIPFDESIMTIEDYNKNTLVYKKVFDIILLLNSKDGDYCDCKLRIKLHE